MATKEPPIPVNCLLHKTCSCTIPVTNNRQLIARLESMINNDRLHAKHKPDDDEYKEFLLKRIREREIWLESLPRDI